MNTPPLRTNHDAQGRTPFPACADSSEEQSEAVALQSQYDNDSVASFFDAFNLATGRRQLFAGYITGIVGADGFEKNVALDFGCGTGWLSPYLWDAGFSKVIGFDPNVPMLRAAARNTNPEFTRAGQICYRTKVPEDYNGKCSLVTALHVHYNFPTKELLGKNFFGPISSLLSKGSHFILIGSPSDYIADTPTHCVVHVHKANVPESILREASSLDVLEETGGYLPLHLLPRHRPLDGTVPDNGFPAIPGDGEKIKVSLRILDEFDQVKQEQEVYDIFWTDKTLVDLAHQSGLELISRQDLRSNGHPRAYMGMVFRKMESAHP